MKTYLVTTDGNESTRTALSEYGKVGKPKFVPEIVIFETDYDKKTILSIDGVEAIDEDEKMGVDAAQVDTGSWHLPWISEAVKYSDDYTYTRTGVGVNVYVVDTGIMLSHDEFNGRASTVYSYDDRDFDKDSTISYHGTACASLVGGKKFGAAKDVTLFNARTNLHLTDIVKSLETIIAHHDKSDRNSIVSISLSTTINVFTKITERMKGKGICLVASSGNEGEALSKFPARNEAVISVGAVSRYNKVAAFSNLGANIFAPGVGIRSANTVTDSSIRFFSGTSASCPLVSGVLAMVLEGSDKLRNSDDVDWAYSVLYKHARALSFGIGLSSNVSNDVFTVPLPEPVPELPKEKVVPEPITPITTKKKDKDEDKDSKRKYIFIVILIAAIGCYVLC